MTDPGGCRSLLDKDVAMNTAFKLTLSLVMAIILLKEDVTIHGDLLKQQ